MDRAESVSTVNVTRAIALYPSRVFLQWDVQSDESGMFFVDVMRAGGPEGPWEPMATGLQDAYNYVDETFAAPVAGGSRTREPLSLFSLARSVYYLVQVTPPSGLGAMFSSLPTPVEPGLDRRTRLLKRKLLRDLSMAFKLQGVPLALLKRRRWGTRCPVCWDKTLNESTIEHCGTCFGTSFLGGFWTPVRAFGRREAAAVQTSLTSHGESDVKIADFILLDYPALTYKDLVVDLRSNDRYEVQRTSPTEMRGVTVHQKLVSSLLARTSIEYRVPVDPTTTPALY